MERTIRVTGKGKVSVKPDLIRLRINQSGIREAYSDAVELSTREKNLLNEIFINLGFQKEDLKTLYFHIDTKYESYRDKQDNWQREFVGYEYNHSMKIEFPADNKFLGKVLYALSKCESTPEFSIEYTVKDPEKSKNELLGNAVMDSKEKAQVLASAADVKLGEIQLIDYSWGEIEFVSRPMNNMAMMAPRAMMCEEDCLDIDVEPDDINVTDTVTVVWTIK